MLNELIRNYALRSAIAAWTIAQVLKVIIFYLQNRKFEVSRLYGSGGMPSSHSAFVMALAVSTGRVYGFNTPVFAVAAGLAAVVMYDAVGVRRAAGKQAAAINWLFNQSGLKLEEQLKELLGHTPLQVLAGAILGIIVGIYMV